MKFTIDKSLAELGITSVVLGIARNVDPQAPLPQFFLQKQKKAENRKKHDPESVLETGIPVTENKNRIDGGHNFCIGSYFCTCTGAA